MSMKALRKAVKDGNKDNFDIGTVIRWLASGTYEYAVIKAGNGRWYVTGGGNYFVKNAMTFDELLEALAKAEVTDVMVAADWIEVK